MKIAIVSTRGIPNNYGGFEEFAEYISVGLVKKGHEVTVYSPHYHPYKNDTYKGVRIKHIKSPELWMGGSLGSFFYDYRSLKDALKNEDFDIIYEAGYTSIIPAYIRFNVKKIRRPVVVTNMDGLEYKRSKYNGLVRRFLAWEEKMAVKHSHHLIADNLGIKDYYQEKYGKESRFLAYGADVHYDYDESFLKEFELKREMYLLIVSRQEPDNNVAMAIDGYLASDLYGKMPMVIVGKTSTKYGQYLVKRYTAHKDMVRFVGGIYDFDKLNSLRHFAYAYLHGHSVGGTNPSLLEAMAAECFILSHDNVFNRSVLGDNALYYSDCEQVRALLNALPEDIAKDKRRFTTRNIAVIRTQYSWQRLIDEHERFFLEILNKSCAF